MTCNLARARALSFWGGWLLLGACDGMNTERGLGGVAGSLQTAGTGGETSAASAGEAGADEAIGAGSALNVAAGGSVEESHAGSGHGAKGGTHSGTGGAGASGGTPNGHVGHGGESAASEVMVPCDVYAAYSVCRNCHIDPPVNGAPMPLLTLEDLQAHAGDIYDAVKTGVMPLDGTLSGHETALILNWLKAGAHGVPAEDCP